MRRLNTNAYDNETVLLWRVLKSFVDPSGGLKVFIKLYITKPEYS